MDKRQLLENLQKQMEADKSLPLRDTANNMVFGEGNPDTKIYFLGEAPGRTEDKLGRPFTGQAGKLLNSLLEKNGLKREDIFIGNMVHFRPPENRDPKPEEIESFMPYLDKQIEIINPKIIVTLGRFSMNKFLPGVKISEVHGNPQEISWHNLNLTIIPLYHPAAALRNGKIKEQLEKDFQVIPQSL